MGNGLAEFVTNGDLYMVHCSGSFRGSFSDVSTPISATKAPFHSVFRVLYFLLRMTEEHSITFQNVIEYCNSSKMFSDILGNSQRNFSFLQQLINCSRFVFRSMQDFKDFDHLDAKITIYSEILKIC